MQLESQFVTAEIDKEELAGRLTAFERHNLLEKSLDATTSMSLASPSAPGHVRPCGFSSVPTHVM